MIICCIGLHQFQTNFGACIFKQILKIHQFNKLISLKCEGKEMEWQQIYKNVKEVVKRNGESELFHKAFLSPFEVALKTWKTEKDPEKMGFLPYGLKQVIKNDIDNNQYSLEDFEGLKDSELENLNQFSTLREHGKNNMISLLSSQKQKRGFRIAICICLYSEDKNMLRRTLEGVGKNIATFNRRGFASHEIGVFVMMDGIEVVHSSVVDYFQTLERQNNIYLQDDIEAINPEQLQQRNSLQSDDLEITNINQYLFSDEEIEDRRKKRFVERKSQYIKQKNMIKKIEAMERDRSLTYEGLDEYVKPFFIEKARKKHQKDYAESDEEISLKKDEYFIENYTQDLRVIRPLIQEALSEAKRNCKGYIETRDNLALVSPFRYEISTIRQVGGSQGREELYEEETSAKMNLFMVTKYKNRGKLSSHNWFFNGFCQELRPEYAVLLDVGLVPEANALVKMVERMEKDKKVGGVCGYMGLKIEKVEDEEEVSDEVIDCVTSLAMKFFDIQRAQQLEYHFAHLIDKPFEAMFGFIHVLPGAYSAYRMEALRPEHQEESTLLKKYFASIEDTVSQQGCKILHFTNFQGLLKVILPDSLYFCIYPLPEDSNSDEQLLYNENVYLAEDRTLCMGIHENKYDLVYLPDAYAWVDPIKTLEGLLGQRKRWINGSFFAFESVKAAMNQCEPALFLQIKYLTIMNILAYVAPALFLFTIHVAMQAFQTDIILPILFNGGFITSLQLTPINQIFIYLVDFIYIMIFLGLVFYSMHLTNRHPKFKPFIYGTSTLFGVFSLIVIAVFIYDMVRGFLGDTSYLTNNELFAQEIDGGVTTVNALRFLILGIFSLYVIPILVSIFAFRRCDFVIDILLSTPAFIFYSPTYLLVLNVYALCRIDDISWGTKGLDSDAGGRTQALQENWKKIKILFVCKFVFWNSLVGFVMILLADNYVVRFYLTFVIMVILGFTLALKILIGLIYILQYSCKNNTCCQQPPREVEEQEDRVEKCFQTIKESLYQDIENDLRKLGGECKEKNLNMRHVVLQGSSIIKKMEFSKNRNQSYLQVSQERSIIISQKSRLKDNHRFKREKGSADKPVVERAQAAAKVDYSEADLNVSQNSDKKIKPKNSSNIDEEDEEDEEPQRKIELLNMDSKEKKKSFKRQVRPPKK